MPIISRFRIAVPIATIAFATTSFGAVQLYSTQAAFDAAAATNIVVTFEESEWDVAVGVSFFGSISSGGIDFVPISSPPTSSPNLFVAPSGQTNFCCPLASRTLTSSGGEDIDLVFAAPPGAVGFVVYANGGDPIVFTLSLTDGTEETFVNPQEPSTVGFVGFVSDVPIAKLNWTSDFGEVINTGIDDVRVDNACPADLDRNGTVDGADLGLLLAAWGAAGGAADLDGSGVVDGADLGLLLAAWGPCAS